MHLFRELKSCASCGSENPDSAVFCSACGTRFLEAGPAPPTSPLRAAQSAVEYDTDLRPGAHEHTRTDLYLNDASGNTVLFARRPSIFPGDCEIVDDGGEVVGFLKSRVHLTHSGLALEDQSHNLQAVAYKEMGFQRTGWVEDATGNRMGTIVFSIFQDSLGARYLAGISLVSPAGSDIFRASLKVEGGILQKRSAIQHRNYSVTLLDKGFPLPVLLATLTTVLCGP